MPKPALRTPPFASTAAIDSQQSNNAALAGAISAFVRPPPTGRPRLPSNASTEARGALVAAASADTNSKTPSPRRGARTTRRSPSPPTLHVTSSPTDAGARSLYGIGDRGQKQRSALEDSANVPNLAVPESSRQERSKSPSHHAAQAAAARAPAPKATTTTAAAATTTSIKPTRPRAITTQRPAPAPKPRRLSDHFAQVSDAEKRTDESPIQPTTSLVKLFENKASGASPPDTIVVSRPSSQLTMSSPRPRRVTDGGITSMFQLELEDRKLPPKLKPKPTIQIQEHQPVDQYEDRTPDDEEFVSASEDTAGAESPESHPERRDSRAPSISSVTTGSRVPAHVAPQRQRSPRRHTHSVHPPPPRQPTSRNVSTPVAISRPSCSGQSLQAQYNQLNPRRMTPLHTGDDLANAMVASSLASSLASSRATSPRKTDVPPPPPSRRHKNHKLSFSRTPSPTKHHTMLHTLRKAPSDDSDTEDEHHPYHKHQKKRLVRKHPNKHHEGDRKRWRDAVTERERKRYEGVWAANKGMYYSFTPDEQALIRQAPTSQQARDLQSAAAEQVSNIVAREIWSRSRLPDSTLEVVWDLVDEEMIGRLTKEQFVVGMWLIDLRLKGRKLPTRIQDSVWASVKSIHGIKIRQ